MTTINDETTRAEAVQVLFDGVMQFGRAMRSRSGDWRHAVRDLSQGDIVTLGLVARQDGTRPGQIASTLGVDPSVVSRQLASLDRLGLIARCVDPADRRAEQIRATALGHERLLQARTAMCEALATRLTEWDLDAIEHAATVVGDLADRLNDTPDTRTAENTEHTEPSKDAHV
ncbi:MAG: hypothetical protein JWR90_1724 [Marmoricola sp.]|nr:hypothetical protein [Marmoricola sp.]